MDALLDTGIVEQQPPMGTGVMGYLSCTRGHLHLFGVHREEVPAVVEHPHLDIEHISCLGAVTRQLDLDVARRSWSDDDT